MACARQSTSAAKRNQRAKQLSRDDIGNKEPQIRFKIQKDGEPVWEQTTIDRLWVTTQREAMIEAGPPPTEATTAPPAQQENAPSVQKPKAPAKKAVFKDSMARDISMRKSFSQELEPKQGDDRKESGAAVQKAAEPGKK